MLKTIIIFASLLFTSLSANAFQENYYWCNNCKSTEDMKDLARSKADLNEKKYVYILDTTNSIIKKYLTHKYITYIESPSFGGEPDGNGGHMNTIVKEKYVTKVEELDVESEKISQFYSYMQTLKLFRSMPVPEDIADSAWDLVGSTSTVRKVSTHFQDNKSLSEHASILISQAAALAGFVNTKHVIIEFDFADGSTGIFYLDFIFEDGRMYWSFLKGFDENGNEFKPETQTIVSGGEYIFKGSQDSVTFKSFLDAVRRSGIPITTSGTSTGTLNPVCVFRDKHMSCTYFK